MQIKKTMKNKYLIYESITRTKLVEVEMEFQLNYFKS